MKTITKYVCETCRNEYDTANFALQCEARGLPAETSHIKLNDEIQFFREQNTPGSPLTYFKDKGTVIYKFCTFNDKKSTHVEIIVCSCKDDKGEDIERQILLIDIDQQGEQLFSPSEYKFKKGWSEFLKSSL